MNKGIWYAIGAYTVWGLFPIYWKWLHQVEALQLVSHRVLWSFVILFIILLLTRQGQAFRAAARVPGVLRIYLVAALLISVNWLTYIWAVNAGFLVETSLGYFINPLISVLLGVIFLREHLRPWQWISIGLAATGVLFLTILNGSLPWIALTLAFSFGMYGFVKKTAPLGSVFGLTIETGILLVPAVLYLLYSESIHQGALLHTGPLTDGMLVGAGIATTIPLLMFASAARRIPLSLVGILQYISPTLQFLLGVLVYKEPFENNQLIGFGIVWAALILFALDGLTAHRTQPVAAMAE